MNIFKYLVLSAVLLQFACVNSSIDYKALHCALESAEIEKDAKILFLSAEHLQDELSPLEWKIEVKPSAEFNTQKANYQYVAVFKKDLPEFKKIIGDANATIAYKFENKELLFYELRKEYYSHFFGAVTSSYVENFLFDNNKKGYFTYKDYKLVSQGDSSYYIISADDEFPFSQEKELGAAATENACLEVRFKLRRKSQEDKKINFVVNLKSAQNLSLSYLKEELTLENPLEWKTFHFYYPLQVNRLVASDKMLMYFWNFFRGDFEMAEFHLTYIFNHTGESRYEGELVSFFNWHPYRPEWQNVDLLNTNEWCVGIPAHGTAFHYYTSASDLKMMPGDFFYSDLSYRTNKDSIGEYIVQMLGDDGKVKHEEVHTLKNTANQWINEMLRLPLGSGVEPGDRILIYFKNNSDVNFDVRKVICSNIRKHECD